tara:strand:+ start:671 stop:1468 length:798 start_codon:yes stop_codon:yes gene_type:complete
MYDFILLGSNGFVGRNLNIFLRANNYKLLCVDRNSKYFNEKSYTSLPPAKFVLYLAEKNIIQDEYDKCFIDLNIKRLESAINASKGSKFIYFSSAVVYGDQSTKPRSTLDKVFSKNKYAESKLKCEHLALANDALAIRLSNLYGTQMHHKNVFTDIISQLNNNKIVLKSLSPIRDFMFFSDLAEFVLALTKKWNNGLYNLGSGKGVKISELVEMFLLFSNSKAEVFSELKDDSPSCLILDIDETSKTFNWKPKIKISEGIRRLLE